MRTPMPGYEDLYPHVAMLDDPANPMHGEAIVPARTLGLMIAPSVEEFLTHWERHQAAIEAGLMKGEFRFPAMWTAGARRRSNELMARYDTDIAFEVLRGLHREYGCCPQGGEVGGQE